MASAYDFFRLLNNLKNSSWLLLLKDKIRQPLQDWDRQGGLNSRETC
jgi:hypothetical protein